MDDVTELLDGLNPAQRDAVAADDAHLLVLAGAGSGKTRVLVHRMAYLIATEQVSPFGLLAVTFTNKAAHEMRGRIEHLLHMPASGMWVGTFHGIAHRLLRAHWQDAGLPESFEILDSDDQQRLIRRVIKDLELDDTRWRRVRRSGLSMVKKTKAFAPNTWSRAAICSWPLCSVFIRPTKTCVVVVAWWTLMNCCSAPLS